MSDQQPAKLNRVPPPPFTGANQADSLPVVVIGAGPVGLAAAAHLVQRGLAFTILEAGATVAASIRDWSHVRTFSPWQYDVDPAAVALLTETGWSMPDPEHLPTGAELIDGYLAPLAAHPSIAPWLRLGARVTSVTRLDHDRMKTPGRDGAPFVVRFETKGGDEQEIVARAVIDASGTYSSPNPLGSSGVAAIGENAAADRIFYGIADVLGRDRARYAGRHVLVVGSGHSAFNVLLDLADLAREAPETTIAWAIRRPEIGQMFGGGDADGLPARGSLGERVRSLVKSGQVTMTLGFGTRRIDRNEGRLIVSDGQQMIGPVDEIIATTGFRPDLAPLRELRLSIDPITESPAILAPLIDPNVHSCGSVPPHGYEELRHPETDFYIVGMKAYGRAPTALMRTGYEQVRSVVAALAGDMEAARRVELVLPETGVCSSGPGGACCVSDEKYGIAPKHGLELLSLTVGKSVGASCCN